jgi:hypothetical protein
MTRTASSLSATKFKYLVLTFVKSLSDTPDIDYTYDPKERSSARGLASSLQNALEELERTADTTLRHGHEPERIQQPKFSTPSPLIHNHTS